MKVTCRLRVMGMVAMVWMASGCAWLGASYHYEPADREGNQCRNECYAAADSVEREECMGACWDYNGGEFTPSAGCFLLQADPAYKEPPQGERRTPSDDFPAPADPQPSAPPPAKQDQPAPVEQDAPAAPDTAPLLPPPAAPSDI